MLTSATSLSSFKKEIEREREREREREGGKRGGEEAESEQTRRGTRAAVLITDRRSSLSPPDPRSHGKRAENAI